MLDKKYSDAVIGLALILSIQLLVIPIQVALILNSISIPASILVMFTILFTMTVATALDGNIERVYHTHLREPADFLGRHMSYGFVAFFVLLSRDYIHSSSTILKIAGVFIVTTGVSYMAAFVLGSGAFRLEKWFRLSRKAPDDLESYSKTWPGPTTISPTLPYKQKHAKKSQQTTVREVLLTKGSSMEDASVLGDLKPISAEFQFQTAPLCVWFSLLITVGIPVYLATNYIMPFEVFLFTLIWLLCLQLQRSLRAQLALTRYRRLQSLLLITTNPLILTWALITAYMWAKTWHTGRNIDAVIGDFRHHSSLSECILHITRDRDVQAHLGAGDLASLLLDAGVTFLGFKMYEYRVELWASLGTVSVTCTALAVINVFLNVLVCRAFGLQVDQAISFAARSATLALGVPAVENLGGSVALTSTLALFSGIILQAVGDWLFSLLRIDDQARQDNLKWKPVLPPPMSPAPIDTPFFTPAESPFFTPTATLEIEYEESASKMAFHEDTAVVAVGITVGINAAAMGTMYLIERKSRATAYSALSMVLFGAATVALTALPGVAEAVTFLASG